MDEYTPLGLKLPITTTRPTNNFVHYCSRPKHEK